MYIIDSLGKRGRDHTFQARVACAVVALAASIWIMPGPLLARDPGNIDKLAIQCRSGKQKACAELAKIALEGKDTAMRGAAVEKLTDQELLARIAMEDADANVRNRAVQSLTDQAGLAKVAMQSPDANVRTKAAHLVTDQTIVAQIALGAPDIAARADAAGRLADQTVLSKVATGDGDAGIRAAASTRLAQLALMAKNAATVAEHVATICALLQQSDPDFVGPDRWLVGAPVRIGFDDATRLVQVQSGGEFHGTSERFKLSSLARIDLDVGSGQSTISETDSSGSVLSSTTKPTQTANVRFVMKKDHDALIDVVVRDPLTRTYATSVLQIIALSCAKDRIGRLQVEIDQVNQLIGATSGPAK